MSSAPVLCSIESDAYGDPPRRARLEARKRPQEGFEVWFWDERVCPEGKIIAIRPDGSIDPRDTYYRRSMDYSAQLLCRLMPPHLGRYQAMDIRPDAWREVKVTGERGLKASMLKLAFNRGMWSGTGWLQRQSDASLALIEAIAGDVLCGEWQRICAEIDRHAEELRRLLQAIAGKVLLDEWQRICAEINCRAKEPRITHDLLGLLDRYGLPASAAGAKGLCQQLKRDISRLPLPPGVERGRDFDAEVDEMLAEHGLTIPHPHEHPDRWEAAHMAIYEHLYDPTTPEAIARDDRIDARVAELGLTLPFPRGHPLRPHAFYEARNEQAGGRPDGWIPFKPPRPADTWTMPSPEPAKKLRKTPKEWSRRSKTLSKRTKTSA